MKRIPILSVVVLGVVLVAHAVHAEDIPSAESESSESSGAGELTPEGTVEEELPILGEGKEGEVTERGIGRFKFPYTPKPKPKLRKRFKVPKPVRLGKASPKQPPPKTPPGTPPDDLPPVFQCEWKTSDIIDPRIENGDLGDGDTTRGAQTSLMRLMNRGGLEERRAASAMIKAIKEEKLAGIHAPFLGRKASADRAASIPPRGTKGYWTLLKPGQDGKCLQKPAESLPMILYRQKNKHPSEIDQILVTAWNQCGLHTPEQPCSFVKDLEDKPQGEIACQADEQCPPGSTCFRGFCVSQSCLDRLNLHLIAKELDCEAKIDPDDVVCINQWSKCRFSDKKSESVCFQEVPCATRASEFDRLNCKFQARGDHDRMLEENAARVCPP